MRLNILPASRPAVCTISALVVAVVVTCLIRGLAQQAAPSAGATPVAAATPAAVAPKDKGLNFSIPLPVGETTREIKIPERGPAGQAISQLMAVSAKRLDEDHLMMEKLVIDLYKPDGRTDYRIALPTSVFDLKTRIIRSNDPVSITTPDFELSGEKMEFDTVARTGKLTGWVYMKIHNAKEMTTGAKEPVSKTP